MTAVVESPRFNSAEPIPGYRVIEHIGAGGYGEVWRAEAPGGIAKAIKIVYGHHDSERAVRELTALNRIKEVRHPFLLSLERIELIEGHLVIVSELATSNLKELFDGFCEKDLVGIPREELLEHLRDTADALDYIAKQYLLQHLDVKPENLLLVGGRIKVADFGLVKDLQDVNSSIIGGLTPVYAAPELFDGRPSIHSDQYSLAIVYQQMLTGTLPYEGRTTAQLAAQHLHCQPRLDRLPRSDQAVVARSLAKDPRERFTTCRELIDRLIEASPGTRGSRGLHPAPSNVAASRPVYVGGDTEVVSPQARPAAAIGVKTECIAKSYEVEDRPPLDLDPSASEYRPTVVLGIGGLGARALQLFKRRLVDRFGDLEAVPSVQLLLLDTDAMTLKEVTEGDQQAKLPHELVAMVPLRQPADYRREPAARLQSISRRWIYNIPRSNQTQGFRPLGRLALIDNLERVLDLIRRSIATATHPESLAISARATGLPFKAAPPRIFVVSSISGGTGSGMAIDVGYAVRKVLQDLGLSEAGLTGILAHGIQRGSANRDLAIANAYSFLGELNHFSSPYEAYPGEPACGLPPSEAGVSPFPNAYVIDFGEDLNAEEFSEAADRLAQYVYCNAVTSAGTFFDRCRTGHSDNSQYAAAMIRTFGIGQIGFGGDNISPGAEDVLGHDLLMFWREGRCRKSVKAAVSLADPASLLNRAAQGDEVRHDFKADASARADESGLRLGPIREKLFALAIQELGSDPDSYLLDLVLKISKGNAATAILAPRLPSPKSILDTLDAIVLAHEVVETAHVCLEGSLEKHVKEMAAAQGAALRAWILGLGTSDQHHLAGVRRVADEMAELLRALSREASDTREAVRQEIRTLHDALLASKKGSSDWLRGGGFFSRREVNLDPRLCRYFQLKIEEATLGAAGRVSRLILTHVTQASDKLWNLINDLNRLAERVGQRSSADSAGGTAASVSPMHRLVGEVICQHADRLVSEVDAELREHLRLAIVGERDGMPDSFHDMLRQAARASIVRLLRDVSLQQFSEPRGEDRPGAIVPLDESVKAVSPRLSECGGFRRRLLVAPKTIALEQVLQSLAQECDAAPTVMADAQEEMFLCCEMDQVPLCRAAEKVLNGRFQNVEVAARLHARADVNWSSL